MLAARRSAAPWSAYVSFVPPQVVMLRRLSRPVQSPASPQALPAAGPNTAGLVRRRISDGEAAGHVEEMQTAAVDGHLDGVAGARGGPRPEPSDADARAAADVD